LPGALPGVREGSEQCKPIVKSREQDRCTPSQEGASASPFLALSESSASISHTISPRAVPLLPLIEPCVRFSRTRLSDALPPPAFACAWPCGIVPSEVIEFGRTAELALMGIRSSYLLQAHEQSNAPSLQLGYAVPTIHTTVGISDSSTGLPFPFHRCTAYRVGYVEVTQRPGEVSPVPQSTLPTFRAPYTGGFFDTALFQVLTVSSMAFASSRQARLPLGPCGYTLTMRQASLHVTDCWVVMTSLLCSGHP
jgi:hypothetical protein